MTAGFLHMLPRHTRTGARKRLLDGRGMWEDAEAVVEAVGKNEHVIRVCWMLSIAIVGLVITNVLDPTGAQQVVGCDCGNEDLKWGTIFLQCLVAPGMLMRSSVAHGLSCLRPGKQSDRDSGIMRGSENILLIHSVFSQTLR